MFFSVKCLPIAAIFIGLGVAANAGAADLTFTTQSYQEPPAFSFGGAYAGVHGGMASPSANPFTDGRGVAAGVQAGYNVQVGPGILGAEVEGSYLGDAEQKVRGGTISEKWRLSAKAKAGVAFDETLVYGTAGYAMTKFENGAGVRRGPTWEGGYLVGGGLEHAFAGGLSAKMEYNYVMTPGVETTTASGTHKADIDSHVIKAGLNLRF